MGWNQLLAILQERRRETEQSRLREQETCPYDGEPVEIKPDGTRFCQFDGVIGTFDRGE